MPQIAVASRIPTDDLDVPTMRVGSLQLFDEPSAIGVSAPVTREKYHNSWRHHVENAVGHRELDYFINSHFPTSSLASLLLIHINAEILESFPERITRRRNGAADERVIELSPVEDKIKEMRKMNTESRFENRKRKRARGDSTSLRTPQRQLSMRFRSR